MSTKAKKERTAYAELLERAQRVRFNTSYPSSPTTPAVQFAINELADILRETLELIDQEKVANLKAWKRLQVKLRHLEEEG